MEEKRPMIVNGYLFDTEKEFKTALKEKNAIDKLMKKVNLNSKDMVLSLYKALITEQKFSTAVGMEYLWKLRAVIVKQKYAPEEEILPIPVAQFKSGRADSFKLSEAEKQIDYIKQAGAKNRERVRTLFIVNIILVLVIAAMMYIASTSNNINILNYEREIRDKYSQWESQLNEREEQIREAERQLGIGAD